MPRIWLKCINCGGEYRPEEIIYRCRNCNELLEIRHDLRKIKVSQKIFDSRLNSKKLPFKSGVWRFKELIHPLVKESEIISRPEGNTNLYTHQKLKEFTGLENLILKHEGENPTGSFKDRGMSVGISEAKRQGAKIVACASTGNTSASLAAYAALAQIKCAVFVPEGKIAFGKLSQALAFGAKVFQIRGNFDEAMVLVEKCSQELGLYLLNSINPWRIEGQKSIIFELIQQLNWEVPDWIVVPAGNLGNISAFGKALRELKALKLIKKIPRLAAIQAKGAHPFYQLWKKKAKKLIPFNSPKTIASAIRIGNPINWKKAIEALKFCNGVVEKVTDQEIMDAKAIIDGCGIGCEPASAASVAGAKKLREKKVIDSNAKVVCILTGNLLKDPEATINYHLGKIKGIKSTYQNKPIVVDSEIDKIKKILKGRV